MAYRWEGPWKNSKGEISTIRGTQIFWSTGDVEDTQPTSPDSFSIAGGRHTAQLSPDGRTMVWSNGFTWWRSDEQALVPRAPAIASPKAVARPQPQAVVMSPSPTWQPPMQGGSLRFPVFSSTPPTPAPCTPRTPQPSYVASPLISQRDCAEGSLRAPAFSSTPPVPCQLPPQRQVSQPQLRQQPMVPSQFEQPPVVQRQRSQPQFGQLPVIQPPMAQTPPKRPPLMQRQLSQPQFGQTQMAAPAGMQQPPVEPPAAQSPLVQALRVHPPLKQQLAPLAQITHPKLITPKTSVPLRPRPADPPQAPALLRPSPVMMSQPSIGLRPNQQQPTVVSATPTPQPPLWPGVCPRCSLLASAPGACPSCRQEADLRLQLPLSSWAPVRRMF